MAELAGPPVEYTLKTELAQFSFLKMLNVTHQLCHCCSVTKFCLALCDCMDCGTPGLPVLRRLLEFA